MKTQIQNSSGKKIVERSTDILKQCKGGKNLDNAIDSLRGEEFERTVSDIVFQYYRNKGKVDYIIATHSNNNKKTPEKFKRILQTAVTQAFLQTGIEPEKAFDIAVGMTKSKYGPKPAGFINAVLRKISNSFPDYNLDKISGDINIPEKVMKRWKNSFPGRLKDFEQYMRKKPVMTFRITSPITSEELNSASCRKLDLPNWGGKNNFYTVEKPSIIFEKDWIDKGKIYIQDPSTSAACSIYKPENGDIVLDLCSAPGGKSIILSELLQDKGFIVSSDLSLNRQKRTQQNIKTHQRRNCQIISASALNPPFTANCADLVFLDVPCTNTGVFRRRPDVLWNFTEKKLKELVNIQGQILEKSSVLVKSKGKIIYSTCSIEPEENSNQINAFLIKHSDFEMIKEIQLLPSREYDGAYCALLKKKT